MSRSYKIIIAGAGGMGRATGLLLREVWDARVDLHIGDARNEAAQEAADWIFSGSSRAGSVASFHLPAEGSSPELEQTLDGADILLDCLPGEEAPRMAALARRHRLHYANLTEHVQETEQIQRIAAGAEQGYILQTGLAPGFVNVLANRLFQDFCRQHGVTSADRIAMRVGALTSVAEPPHYYAFTWSTIGVATEYVQPSRVVRDFETVAVPSLEGVRPILIGGVVYEEALTSGGAADLPTALQGRVRHLDYKTLRYPGHYAWVKALLAAAPAGADRVEYLHERMLEVVPFVDNDDLVVIFAAVEGRAPDGILRRHESSKVVHPIEIAGHRLKAIQATTSAGLAESARLLLERGIQGVCLQSQIDAQEFMAGPFVGKIYR